MSTTKYNAIKCVVFVAHAAICVIPMRITSIDFAAKRIAHQSSLPEDARFERR